MHVAVLQGLSSDDSAHSNASSTPKAAATKQKRLTYAFSRPIDAGYSSGQAPVVVVKQGLVSSLCKVFDRTASTDGARASNSSNKHMPASMPVSTTSTTAHRRETALGLGSGRPIVPSRSSRGKSGSPPGAAASASLTSLPTRLPRRVHRLACA